MQIVNITTQSQHIPKVAAWLYHEWGHLHPGSTLESEIRDLQQSGTDQLPLTFIAVKDNQLLGTVSILSHDMDTRPELTPWIASLFVPPVCRKRGIGTQLFRFAEQQCLQLGFTTVYLFTADRQAMYARLGWQILELMELHGEHVTIMRKCFVKDIIP